MIRNIIWDVDGTLFDTYPAIALAFKAALNDLGADASLNWIEGLARKSLGYCASTLAGKYQLDPEVIEQAFGSYYDLAEPKDQPPFPGVIAICDYICTSGGKNVIVTHRGRQGTAELLEAHHMTGYFAGCVTRDDGYPKKPDPAAFEAVLKSYGLERGQTVAVGDRDIDVLAGQAAGLTTCLFGPVVEGVVVDLTVSSFDQLYQYLVRQAGNTKGAGVLLFEIG